MSNDNLLLKEIKVGLQFYSDIIPVGRLATLDGYIFFEYEQEFIQSNLEISPFKLPLEPGLIRFNNSIFEGLAGVFNDSLPDGWGRLLFDRFMRNQSINPERLTPLDRLAHVGKTGLGALVYEPDYPLDIASEKELNLDQLFNHTQDILFGQTSEVIKELMTLNGSSAGARPKALIGLNVEKDQIIAGKDNLPNGFEHWLVKFSNSTDGFDAGAIEYVYGLMAKKAGLDMMPIHLFYSKHSAGFFATQRFDRQANKKWHMHSAGGLLHSNFRFPSLDYEDLISLTHALTQDVREVEKMYRLAIFNVMAHNRDDHAKNFSFLMDDKGEWKLSPAYDLTFSSGPRGHLSTMVLGEGQNPSLKHLFKLGEIAGLEKTKVKEIINQTETALQEWERLANEFGVSKPLIPLVRKSMLI